MKKNAEQYSHLCAEYLITDKNNLLSEYAKIANNLYNASLYQKRQQFIKKHNLVNYSWLNKLFKHKIEQRENMLYHQFPYVQTAQQILKEVDRIFYAYFMALKTYKVTP